MNEKITELERLVRQLTERVEILEDEINPKSRKMKERIKAYNERTLKTEQDYDTFCQHVSQKFNGQFVPNYVIREEYLKMFPDNYSKFMTSNKLTRKLKEKRPTLIINTPKKIKGKVFKGVIFI